MSMKKTMNDLLVIGGGAAGMLAAATAAEAGLHVLLLEKYDRCGKKLAITGKGRCNLTNACPPAEVLRSIPRNGRFLFSAMHAFPPDAVMAYFEAHGCPLKIERGNRVFPVSDRAADCIAVLENAMRDAGVSKKQAAVRAILTQDGAVTGVKTEQGQVLEASRVLLCTGGASYPLTGSTGDGYRMAEAVGHTIVPPVGSLVPLEADGCAQMQGLSLRNTGLKLLDANGKVLFRDFGELLFTHFGLSGPMVLSASAHMPESGGCTVVLDLKPALDEAKLDARLLRDLTQYANRSMENALADLFPNSLILPLLHRAGIAPSIRANSLTRQQRRALLEQTKGFSIPIRAKRPVEEAIVTRGGVSVKEIDPKTMQSKRIHGLYFAGEVIDCDAYTGGFNLQIAWATARAAALAIANE